MTIMMKKNVKYRNMLMEYHPNLTNLSYLQFSVVVDILAIEQRSSLKAFYIRDHLIHYKEKDLRSELKSNITMALLKCGVEALRRSRITISEQLLSLRTRYTCLYQLFSDFLDNYYQI